MVKKHIRRVLPKSWGNLLMDPRRCARSWKFSEILEVVMAGMLSGCRNLRELEFLSAMSGKRIPDTTAWDLLVQTDPTPLEREIAQGVKQAARSHELDQRELPFALTVIDGKSIRITNTELDQYCSNRSQKGCTKYVTTALRAFHASSSLKLLMGQQLVKKGTNERGTFGEFLEKLVTLYGRTKLLQVISIDAGITSIRNAQSVVDHGLDYIMALKDPRTRKATKRAIELLGELRCAQKIQREHLNGKHITRKLFRCAVPELQGWEHACEFWRVEKTTETSSGSVSIENRYFITSLEAHAVTNSNALKAVRLHWSIENNANWVMDTAWQEDDNPWCNKAVELMSLLRILAYNAVARLKLRRFRKAQHRQIPWRNVLAIVRQTLFPFNQKDISALA